MELPLPTDVPPSAAATPLILVVDDDALLRATMCTALEDEGYQVTEAEDGVAACASCDAVLPNLIVADAAMPRMDGFALCRELRSRPAAAHVPILMATGFDDRASIAAAYDAGATDFIAKPFDWLILTHRIRYMLRTADMLEVLRSSEAWLRAAKDAAEAADRAKSDFLGNMSHELRTPLNAVIGFSRLMLDGPHGPLDPRYHDFAKIIADSGEHLLGLIDDILAMARASPGSLDLVVRQTPIADIVGSSLDMVRLPAAEAGVSCSSQLDPDIDTVYADPARLRQILVNLLSNAIKFTEPPGAISLTVRRQPDGGFAVHVADTGIGIAADKIALALEPFGQVEQGLSRRHAGIGLGLPLAQRLVELHGGTIEITSEPGLGTMVTARFPPARG
jgi:signal transduction histidine kinase